MGSFGVSGGNQRRLLFGKATIDSCAAVGDYFSAVVADFAVPYPSAFFAAVALDFIDPGFF